MDILFAISDSIGNFFTMIGGFVTSGIYELLVWLFAKLIEKLTIGWLDMVLWALPFAWDAAKQIMLDLNLNALIQTAWGDLDSNLLALATVLRIPDAVNVLISAFFTKFVLRFIPFI